MSSTTATEQQQQGQRDTSSADAIVLNNIACYDVASTHPFGHSHKDRFDKAMQNLTTNLKAIQDAIQMKKERAEGELHGPSIWKKLMIQCMSKRITTHALPNLKIV